MADDRQWPEVDWDAVHARMADEEFTPSHHICGVGGVPRPGSAEYRCCRCGQWYHWRSGMWRETAHPPQHWLDGSYGNAGTGFSADAGMLRRWWRQIVIFWRSVT